MVVNDYGKRAYYLACKLEKRLEKLEKNAIESTYNEVIFNFSDSQNSAYYQKAFSVNALRENKYLISGSIAVSGDNNLEVLVNVYVGGVLANSFNLLVNEQKEFSFESTFKKGVNEIRVEVNSTGNILLDELNFKICGTVNYLESSNSLSSLVYEGIDYIGHFCNDKFTIYKYDTSVGLIKLKEILGVLEATFFGVKDGVIYMAGIDTERNLIYLQYNLNNGGFIKRETGVKNVSSVCGYLINYTLVMYFSKLNEIYKGGFTNGNDFICEKTGRKGVKLYSDPLACDRYVVVDKLLNTKLIVN